MQIPLLCYNAKFDFNSKNNSKHYNECHFEIKWRQPLILLTKLNPIRLHLNGLQIVWQKGIFPICYLIFLTFQTLREWNALQPSSPLIGLNVNDMKYKMFDKKPFIFVEQSSFFVVKRGKRVKVSTFKQFESAPLFRTLIAFTAN